MEENKTKEAVEVKVVDEAPQTPQEKEAAVLDKAVKEGEVSEEYGLQKDGVYKINVDKPPVPKKEIKKELKKEEKNAIQGETTDSLQDTGEKGSESGEKTEVALRGQSSKEDKIPENKEEVLKEESASDSPLELIKEEPQEKKIKQEKIETPVKQEEEKILQEEKKIDLPEGVDKLVQFMNETGGTVEDYAKLNRDYSKIDNVSLLKEYYEYSKPHLDQNDIKFLMDKNFAYDEAADDPSDIKAKQLAFKEELYNAQTMLENAKKKYYSDLKLRKQSEIPKQHQQALEYYNNSQKQQERSTLAQKDFLQETNKVFNEEFKGFDFKVGENKYRVKIDDPAKIKESQSDIKNFLNNYSNTDGKFKDIGSYHKAIYAAQNADKLANHFYEQGRADAIKESAKNAKNINMDPRQEGSTVTTKSGDRIRVVSGDSSDKLRIKWKQ